MKMSAVAAIAVALLLSGCASNPATPMDAYLNRAAGAEVAARNCASMGGYSSVAQMRSDAQTNMQRARELGATEEHYNQALSRMTGQFNTQYIFLSPFAACNALINSLAWGGTAEVRPEDLAPTSATTTAAR